jgi:hypothetical protein
LFFKQIRSKEKEKHGEGNLKERELSNKFSVKFLVRNLIIQTKDG